MHTSLKNKTTLVTGVSSGIGREIAQLLAERGARVFGTVRDPKSAKPINGVEIVRMDVTDDASVSEAVRSIEQKAGPVPLLVNNAGYSFMGAVEETSIEEARQQFRAWHALAPADPEPAQWLRKAAGLPTKSPPP